MISSNAAMNSCWLSINRRSGGSLALPASFPRYQGFWVKTLYELFSVAPVNLAA